MRKTLTYTVQDDGRDKGKVFLLTEMPAMQGGKWGVRAFMMLAKAGIEVPEEVASQGLAGMAAVGIGIFAHCSFNELEPLMDELMTCVKVVPDPKRPEVVRERIEDDIEEIMTLAKLQKEVFELHTGFFAKGALLTSTSEKTTTGASENT